VIISTLPDLPDDRVVATNGENSTSSSGNGQAQKQGNGTGPKRWWRHNNRDTNSCTGFGIYCFNRKNFMDADAIKNFTPEVDEILMENNISLNRDVITIRSVGVKGNLSPNTLKAFKDKKVEPMGHYMPMETLDLFLKTVDLKAPKEGINFKPEEQSYTVIETTFEGKKVNIVKAVEKANIVIAGKIYTLVIISTSGRGDIASEDTRSKTISEKGVSSTKGKN